MLPAQRSWAPEMSTFIPMTHAAETGAINRTGTRGHRYKLYVEQSNHNVRYYFFSRRVVNPWNNLPVDTHLLLGLKLH